MKGLGYIPSLPDFRDFSVDHAEVSPRLAALGQPSILDMLKNLVTSTPSSVDLREYCSPIHDQGSLQSCTAHAATSLLEFMQKKTHGKYTEMSRLYVYYCTRFLMRGNWLEQDSGAYMRSAMAALRLYGAPPEVFYPYNESKVNDRPSPMLYSLAEDFEATQYTRLDNSWLDRLVLLKQIKRFLASGIPIMFGFSVFENINGAAKTGEIPLPAGSLEGGHAVVAVGYREYPGQDALLIQNSWGSGWGLSGFGWLPLDYIKRGLAQDFWALLKADWVNMEIFS